jgi:glutathione peroxidase
MKPLSVSLLLGLMVSGVQGYVHAEGSSCPETLDHSFRLLAGEQQQRLCDAHRDKLILVVNTASQCGYTYQYEGLEHLQQRFAEGGLVVVGFPSNDFGRQEPGAEQQIQAFCRDQYSIQFPIYEKIHAAKGLAHPFIEGLAQRAGEYPSWNFHKYLIDRQGNVVGSWGGRTEPESAELVGVIKRYL